MLRKVYSIFMLAGFLGFCVSAHAAEVRMGDKVFQGKVTVHQDGTVTTESTAKEEEIEGEGKKRLRLMHKDGQLMVVDEKGAEVVMEEGGTKLRKKSRFGHIIQPTATPSATPLAVGSPKPPSPKSMKAFRVGEQKTEKKKLEPSGK